MNNQHNSRAPLSAFDQDFGNRHFEPVEETVVIDGEIASKLLDRRRPGDPELAKKHRLLVVDPTGEEWEYPIESEIMIGRAEDNHISLPDRAVSRHHLAINTDGQLYWFQDLNSGNGTQVNQEFVKEGWLTGGEEIVVGNSHLYFLVPELDVPPDLAQMEANYEQHVEPSDYPLSSDEQGQLPIAPMKSAPKESGGNRWVGAIVVLVIGLSGLGMVGWWLYKELRQPKPSGVANTSQTGTGTGTDSGARPDQQALQWFEQGKDALKRQDWEQADSLLRKAASTIPLADPMRGVILRYAELASKELIAHHLYRQAQQYYNQDQIEKALSTLRRVPENSKIYNQAEKLQLRIFKKEVDPRMKMLRLQLEGKRTADAMKTLNELLRIAPQYQPALQIKKQLESGDVPTTPSTQPPVTTPRRAYINEDKLPSAFQTGANYFCQGQYAEAIVYFRQQESDASSAGLRRVAQKFRERIQDFERDLNRGVNSARRGSSSGLPKLKSAQSIDSKYFGGCQKSSYGKWLSRLYYKRSRRNYRRRNYKRAASYIRKARRLNPQSTKIFRASQAVRTKAKRLINEAKVLLNIDNTEARKYLQQAMGMLPSSDPLYRQAKQYYDRAQ